MMLGAFETLLDRTPPPWLRKAEATMLLDAFARAFQVEPPDCGALSAEASLAVFREFTAACMEAALADAQVAQARRERLGRKAHALGARVRAALPVRGESAFRLVRFLYRGIGIDLVGQAPGRLRFGPCSFAQRYTPADCWFMSAFDEGFIGGVLGVRGTLEFSERLTEGCPCCQATFAQRGGAKEDEPV